MQLQRNGSPSSAGRTLAVPSLHLVARETPKNQKGPKLAVREADSRQHAVGLAGRVADISISTCHNPSKIGHETTLPERSCAFLNWPT